MKKLLVILTSVMFLGGQVFPALAVVGGVGGNDIKPNSVQAPLRAPAMDPALGEILQKKAPSVFQDPLEGPTSGVLASHATGASLLHDWGYKGKGSKIAIIAEEFNPEGILNLAKKGAIAQAALTFDDFLPVDIQKNLSLADINVDHIYDVQLKTLVGGSAHLAPGGQKNWHQEMDNLARLARLKKRYDASKEEGYFSFGQAYLELTHQMAPDATLLPLNFWNAPQVGDDPKGVGRILNTLQMAIDEGVDTIHLELANASLWSKEDWGLLTGMLKATRDKGIMTFMAAKDETTFEKIHHFDKPGQENIPFDQILKDLGQKGLAIVGGTTYLDASEAPEVSGYSSLPSRGETPFLLAPGEKVYGNFSSTYLASSVAAGAYGLLKGYARQHKIPLTNPQDLLNVLMESGTGTAPNRFWTHKEAGPEVKTIDVASALRLLHQKTFSPRPNVAPVPAPGKSSALAQAQKKPQVKPAKAQDQGVFLNPEDPQNSKVSIPGSTKVDIFHKGGFKGKGMKIAVIENEFRPDALIKFAKKGLIDDKILAMQGLLKEDLAANIDFKKLNLTQLQKDIDRASLALAGAHLPQDQKLWWEERSRLMRWYAFKQEYDEDKAIGGSHGYGALDAAHQMAPEATLVPIKINQFSKSDDADEVRIQQLRAIQTAIDEGVDAINFSIRWMDNSIEYIKGIADLFKVARDKGIAIFISAGNDSSDEAIQRTDAYADINTIANKLDFKGFYTIGATQYRPDASPAIGQVAGWWGTALPSKGKFEDIFLMAPGVSLSLKNSKVGHGTSFASPATAGAYVLLKQYAQKNKLSFKGPDELFQTLKTAGTAVTQHSWGDEKLPPFQTINMENALKAMEERLAASKAKAEAEAKAEKVATAAKVAINGLKTIVAARASNKSWHGEFYGAAAKSLGEFQGNPKLFEDIYREFLFPLKMGGNTGKLLTLLEKNRLLTPFEEQVKTSIGAGTALPDLDLFKAEEDARAAAAAKAAINGLKTIVATRASNKNWYVDFYGAAAKFLGEFQGNPKLFEDIYREFLFPLKMGGNARKLLTLLEKNRSLTPFEEQVKTSIGAGTPPPSPPLAKGEEDARAAAARTAINGLKTIVETKASNKNWYVDFYGAAAKSLGEFQGNPKLFEDIYREFLFPLKMGGNARKLLTLLEKNRSLTPFEEQVKTSIGAGTPPPSPPLAKPK